MECYDTPVLLVVMDDAQHVSGFSLPDSYGASGTFYLSKRDKGSMLIELAPR